MLETVRIQNQKAKLKEAIIRIDSKFFEKFSIEAYVADVKSYSALSGYQYFSQEMISVLRTIQTHYNFYMLALYQKLVIILFIEDSLNRLKEQSIPSTILNLYHEWFERVVDDFSIQTDEFYHYKNDPFLKDFGVCSLRLIPVGGPWILDRSGTGIKFLFNGGFKQFVGGLRFLILKAHGLKPFYVFHLVDRLIDKFNKEEREKCFMRIGKLLRLNPEIRGVKGRSWLYDPTLERVSPRLAYVTRSMTDNGAQVFRIGTTQDDIDNATRKSATRRELYRQIKYVPTGYLIIWTRRDLISWTDKFKQKRNSQLS